jgi:2-keto-4-pentenoate hydratase/2-oxohepta-3-ene-1,7-dioic acid hydratase in catechol pathway
MEDTNREIDFKRVSKSISDHMLNLKYNNGDLSDIGNEIGFSIGQSLKNMSQDEIDDFISGFKHGVSLTNGTH